MTFSEIIARIRALVSGRKADSRGKGASGAPPDNVQIREKVLRTRVRDVPEPAALYRGDLAFVKADGCQEIREPGNEGRCVARLLDADEMVGRLPMASGIAGPSARRVANAVLDTVPVYKMLHDTSPLALTAALRNDGLTAAPVHAVGMAGHWIYFPGQEAISLPGHAVPTPATLAARPDRGAKRRTVAVIDTGVVAIDPPAGTHASLLSGISPLGPEDVEGSDLPAALRGHGSFIGSLIRQVDPSLNVIVAALEPVSAAWRGHDAEAVEPNMLTDELQLLAAVIRMADHLISEEIDTVALNLSLGAMVAIDGDDGDDGDAGDHDHGHDHDHGVHGGSRHGDAHGKPGGGSSVSDVDSLGWGIRAAVDYWKNAPWPNGVAPPIIAAAGNNGHDEPATPPAPLVPAAYSDVCAVVATDAQGNEAPFTFRAWPTDTNWVSAPGVSIVGCRGLDDKPMKPSADLSWAWGGTSFATALVSAATASTTSPKNFDLNRVTETTIDGHTVTVLA